MRTRFTENVSKSNLLGSSTRRFQWVLLLLLAATSTLSSAVAEARKVVFVSNTQKLYQAVNDTRNAGALLILAPTRYVLDPNAPNGGRLELQRDMGLLGSGSMESTIIDASALTTESFSIVTSVGKSKSGAVRMGRGNNSLAMLTVEGAVSGASGITTDLIATGPTHVQITSVLARNNPRGLDVRNFGPDAAGRVLRIDIASSVFMDNTTAPGQGIRIANISAPGATIHATLSGNQSYGNVAGCLAVNLDTSNSSITIESAADRFDGNSNGCLFIAGLRQGLAAVLANAITVRASASTFENNTGQLPAVFPEPGGIIAIGGQSIDNINPASNNTLSIDLLAATLGNNQGTDITAYGALSSAGQPAGIGNAVVIRLLATTAVVAKSASEPPEPAGTNTITVLP